MEQLKYAGVKGGRRRWLCRKYYIDCWRDGNVWFTVGIPDGETWVETGHYNAPTLRDALSIAQEMIRADRDASTVRPDLYIGRGRWGERYYRVHGEIVSVFPTPEGIFWEWEHGDVYPAETVSSALEDAEEYITEYQQKGDEE